MAAVGQSTPGCGQRLQGAGTDHFQCQQFFTSEEEGSDPSSLHDQETKGAAERIPLSFGTAASHTLARHFRKAGPS